jgi:hypothetical protein
MHYELSHTINTDPETFWSKLFFDPELNRTLYVEELKFTSYKVLEDHTAPDGSRSRRLECVPKIDVPAAARAFFGNSAGYTEIGRFDPTARRYFMDVIPAFGADKIQMKMQIWVEPIGPKQITRHIAGDATVKIFGLSRLIESVTQQQSRDTYSRAAEVMNRWIAQKGL